MEKIDTRRYRTRGKKRGDLHLDVTVRGSLEGVKVKRGGRRVNDVAPRKKGGCNWTVYVSSNYGYVGRERACNQSGIASYEEGGANLKKGRISVLPNAIVEIRRHALIFGWKAPTKGLLKKTIRGADAKKRSGKNVRSKLVVFRSNQAQNNLCVR